MHVRGHKWGRKEGRRTAEALGNMLTKGHTSVELLHWETQLKCTKWGDWAHCLGNGFRYCHALHK